HARAAAGSARGESPQREAQLALAHFWAGSLSRAVIDGDIEGGSLMAGQSVAFVTREQSTAEIIEEFVSQALAALAARSEGMRRRQLVSGETLLGSQAPADD